MLYACILAGGRGERFWPLSRASRPKQLANVTGEGTMLALTVSRLRGLVPPERVLIVTGADLADAIRGEVPDVPAENVIGEPVGRNSAPAIVLAAGWIREREADAAMLVAPSDHVVDPDGFGAALEDAHAYVAERDVLLTFGIAPSRPETAFGYIESGDALTPTISRAVSFHEKPDHDTAESFAASGKHSWNSGMFVWRVDAILRAVRDHHPELAAAAGALSSPAPWEERLATFYERTPSISIDYAVMERAANVVVRRSDFRWCDVGSWSAMGDVIDADRSGNVSVGRVLASDTEDCVLYSGDGLLAVVGIRNIVAVRVGDVTMICPRDQAERVRELVSALGPDDDLRRYL